MQQQDHKQRFDFSRTKETSYDKTNSLQAVRMEKVNRLHLPGSNTIPMSLIQQPWWKVRVPKKVCDDEEDDILTYWHLRAFTKAAPMFERRCRNPRGSVFFDKTRPIEAWATRWPGGLERVETLSDLEDRLPGFRTSLRRELSNIYFKIPSTLYFLFVNSFDARTLPVKCTFFTSARMHPKMQLHFFSICIGRLFTPFYNEKCKSRILIFQIHCMKSFTNGKWIIHATLWIIRGLIITIHSSMHQVDTRKPFQSPLPVKIRLVTRWLVDSRLSYVSAWLLRQTIGRCNMQQHAHDATCRG